MNHINLALGAMNFGTVVAERAAFALLDQFVEAGGEWIDTADCYAFWASPAGFGGQSEDVLGRWLRKSPEKRERVKLSTKFGAEPIEPARWPASRTGLADHAVRHQLEESLRRLGTDHVELAWAHMEDRGVPPADLAATLSSLVADGHAAAVGLSNHPAWRAALVRTSAVQAGGTPISALQHSYSYLHPRPGTLPQGQVHRFGMLTDEHLDLAATHDLGIWAYSPLLSGAYDNSTKPLPEAFDHPGTARRLALLDELADETGLRRGQIVLAWLAGHTPAVRPILGASKPEQLTAALEAVTTPLPSEVRVRIDQTESLTPLGVAPSAAAAGHHR